MTSGSLPPRSALSHAADHADIRGAIGQRSRAEQIDTLYRQAPGNYLVTLTVATVVCGVLYSHLPGPRLWSWLAAVMILTAIRFLLVRRYHAVRPQGDELRTWANLHVATSLAAGVLWGSAAHLLMPHESLTLQAFVYIVIAGMMAGAALSLTVYLPAYFAFVAPIGLLVLLRLMNEASFADDYGRAMAALAALLVGWVAVTCFFARTANASYLRALRLDRENRALDRVLAERIVDIETSNRTLAAQVALRESMETDLRMAKEQLQLALRASELSIWDWRLEHKRVYLDAAWSAMLGHEPVARHFTIAELIAIVHPDDLATARKAQLACLKGETEEYSVEHRVRTARGDWMWIMSRGRVAERNAQGLATRMIGTNLDISDRKAVQARIEALNKALQANVAELADANRDLQNFSTMVSHDLHAPLRRITGFSDMLVARYGPSLPGEAQQFLQRICHNAARMSTLIDDLLEFARSTSTKLTCEPCDLDALMREVVAETNEAHGAPDITCEIGPLPWVNADRSLLKVALANLVGNAYKFTRTCPRRRVEIGACDSSAQEHVVFVRDNGVGFDPQYKERMFLAFQRLHSDREFEGTGIGLTTVHRIVERHGGRLWAEGDIGQGATFYLALPRRAADEPGPVAAA